MTWTVALVPEMPACRCRRLTSAMCIALAVHACALWGINAAVPVASHTPAPDAGVVIDLAPVPAPLQAPIQNPVTSAPSQEEIPLPAKEMPALEKSEPAPMPEQVLKKTPPPKTQTTPKKAASAKKESPKKSKAQAVAPVANNAPAQTEAVMASSPEVIDPTSNRKPVYPELARQRGQEGLVMLLAHIDERGNLTSLEVSRSSGHSLLDAAALKAVRQWRFRPARRAGVAVRGTVAIPVEFRLRTQ